MRFCSYRVVLWFIIFDHAVHFGLKKVHCEGLFSTLHFEQNALKTCKYSALWSYKKSTTLMLVLILCVCMCVWLCKTIDGCMVPMNIIGNLRQWRKTENVHAVWLARSCNTSCFCAVHLFFKKNQNNVGGR